MANFEVYWMLKVNQRFFVSLLHVKATINSGL